jgi:ribosome-associated toxin RatA of RatAB toxin-antitoxin module
MLAYNIFCIIPYEETKIVLHRAEEMFPSLKESQRYPYTPKLA